MTTDSLKTEASYLDTMKAAVVDALEDIKGFDIAVMDVRKLTNMTSYMIVASATSSRQAKAMGDNVREKMKEKGYHIRGTEGEKARNACLLQLRAIMGRRRSTSWTYKTSLKTEKYT
jgi:ribosome-associated protein